MYKHVPVVCVIGAQIAEKNASRKINHAHTDGFQIKPQDLMGLGFLNGALYLL